MANYALRMTDGSVAIMQTFNDATVEECLAKWSETSRAKVVSFLPIDLGLVPVDRTYRNAWTLIDGQIVHDIEKARAIHLDRLRAWRAPKLAALDIEYMRALERGDQAAMTKVAGDKQALRDLPATIGVENATTVDELKSLWPTT